MHSFLKHQAPKIAHSILRRPFFRKPDEASVIRWMDAAHLPSWLSVDPLAEPHAGAASVLIDELDAGGLQSRVNLSYRIASAAQFPICRLKSSDGWF
jgi:hypothetical protein